VASLGWSEPTRVRRSVHFKKRHLGYVTAIDYPNRDLTAFTEGSPYREIVIADPQEQHVALLQCYKEHWLIQCGDCYGTTDRSGELSEEQALHLAAFTLLQSDTGHRLVGWVKKGIEEIFGRGSEPAA
jgi:hypothetical protein